MSVSLTYTLHAESKKLYNFDTLMNSPKRWKSSKGIFWYSSARPPTTRGPGHLPGLLNG